MSELGQKIIDAVRAKAAELPDYIYQKTSNGSCKYIHHGAPSCIIGHALWNVGLINAHCDFDKLDLSSFGYVIREHWDLSDREIKWLEDVQYKQDRGTSWGNAVVSADAEAAAAQ